MVCFDGVVKLHWWCGWYGGWSVLAPLAVPHFSHRFAGSLPSSLYHIIFALFLFKLDYFPSLFLVGRVELSLSYISSIVCCFRSSFCWLSALINWFFYQLISSSWSSFPSIPCSSSTVNDSSSMKWKWPAPQPCTAPIPAPPWGLRIPCKR